MKDPRLGFRIPWRALFRHTSRPAGGVLDRGRRRSRLSLSSGSWPAFQETQLEVLPRYAAMAERTSHYWEMAVSRVVLYLGLWTWVATGLAFLMAEWRDLSRLAPVLVAAAVGFACTASQFRFTPSLLRDLLPLLRHDLGIPGGEDL